MEHEDNNKAISFGIIYMAVCIPNGKKYIGQTTSGLKSRMRTHYAAAVKYARIGLFQSAIRKHGWGNFEWSILTTRNSKAELNLAEIDLIESHKSMDRALGYNMTEGGTGGAIVESLPNKLEIYKRRGAAISGEKNGFYGKTHSEETKRKISEIQIGRVQSAASRSKRSDSLKGRIFPESVKLKISKAKTGPLNAMFGVEMTDSHKQKIRDSMNKYWAERKAIA